MKIVIDSSVWIAAAGSDRGYARQIIDTAINRKSIYIVITYHILDEITINLEKKLTLSRFEAFNVRAVIKNSCNYDMDVKQSDINKVSVISYSPDKPILALCVMVNADYLVTFDHKHLLSLGSYKTTQIVEPIVFYKILTEHKE